jgi:tRNA dimethylallyltransferase
LSDDSAGSEIAVICGPTGAGKTSLALEIAALYPGDGVVVVSADSRQLYRGFDVGTAKPTLLEREAVPHLGIDVAEPTRRYSAAEWAAAAERWIGEARASGRVPLVVGGTGLYLRALFEGLFEEPALDPERRLELTRELETHSTAELRRWVLQLDPARAHLGRTQLLRAAEVALLTGVPMSSWHRRASRAPRLRPRYLLVDPGAALARWNEARIDRMLAAGWSDEVESLMMSVPHDAPAWSATGYRTLRRLACAETDAAAAREAIVIETRQYVKRQRTWFRHQLPPGAVTTVDPSGVARTRMLSDWWRRAGSAHR